MRFPLHLLQLPGASSVMLKNSLIVSAPLLPGGVTNAQQLATGALLTLVQHPHHCAIDLGGPDYAADGADQQYGEASAAAVSELGELVHTAFSKIRTACLAKQSISTDPEIPKYPTS